ncbi:MAG: outer membrane lipoprotein LolB [Burkholderiaceae bacterium]
MRVARLPSRLLLLLLLPRLPRLPLLQRAATLICAGLLAACAALPSPSTDTAAGTGNVRFASQETAPKLWAGRFSVTLRATPPGDNESAQGRFQLEASGDAAERTLALTLTSPFGQRIAQGTRQADGASRLELADGRVLRDTSLDGVVEQALGWPLPLERLPQWLDDRFDDVVLRDAQGAISQAVDSGWLIEREPGRWALARTHPRGHLRVVLVIDR